MKILYLTKNEHSVMIFQKAIDTRKDVQRVKYSDNLDEAKQSLKENAFDILFIDSDMFGQDGLKYLYELKKIKSDLYTVIYIEPDSELYISKFNARRTAMFLAPRIASDIIDVLDCVQRVFMLKRVQPPKVFIKTFGNFEIFIDGSILPTKSAKTRELFALLIDHNGSSMTNEEIFSYLWEDKPYNKSTATYVRKTISALRKRLTENNIQDIVSFGRNRLCINRKFFIDGISECDFYSVLSNKPNYIDNYNGYYMFQYSWAEETNSIIENKIKHIKSTMQ